MTFPTSVRMFSLLVFLLRQVIGVNNLGPDLAQGIIAQTSGVNELNGRQECP